MVKTYIPKQGDVVYLDFNPTKVDEQKGIRPAVLCEHIRSIDYEIRNLKFVKKTN